MLLIRKVKKGDENEEIYLEYKKMIGKIDHQGARGVGELSLTHSCSH
jgi:hypothetical protein